MEFLENVPLAPYTTFHIGGPARWFAEAASESDILEGVNFAEVHNLPLFVLGGGSNLLVSDRGFPGLVLRNALRGITETPDGDRMIFQVAAGESWDQFVERAVRQDYAGVECLAGIPGTVGGTPVQNVGAYGQEVSEAIRSVRAIDIGSRNFVELKSTECAFAYRESLFNTSSRGKFIVTRVDYALAAGGLPALTYADLRRHFDNFARVPSLAEVAAAVRTIRRQKGMYLVPGDPDCASAGSFFKNPIVAPQTLAEIQNRATPGTTVPHYATADGRVKLAAAWLLDQAGFGKGYGSGRAGISSRHTLALVNRGGATAEDVLELSATIAARVAERFGVQLEREPVFVE